MKEKKDRTIQQNQQKGKNLKYIECFFTVFLLCVFAYYILGEFFAAPDVANTGSFEFSFSREWWELLITFVTLVLSVISVIGSYIFRLCYHRKVDLEYLGWGILLIAVWNIANSDFRQLLFKTPSMAVNIAYLVIILTPFPFFFYLNEVQKGRYRKLYGAAGLLLSMEFTVFSVLHFSHLSSFSDNFFFITLFCSLSVLIVIITFFLDVYKKHIREYLFVAVSMAVVWLAAFVRIASFLLRGRVPKGDAVLPAGLIILLLLAAVNTIHRLIALEQKKQQALLASEAKGRFLANMSHEIRTPINAVLGMDAMILRECTDTSIREYALDIQNAGQNLLSLINDILDLSKIESGKLEVLPEEYDLGSLLHDVMNMISMKAKDKDLTVNLSVDESLPSRFWGDDTRLRQILVNLMNNAVKYTEKGGVTLTVRSNEPDIPQDSPSLSLFFQVEDTGIGIRQEDLAKLFREFERIEEERNRNIEGTGLGMSITTQLLELMGSKLQVESDYGKGSKFYFTLEQKIMDAEPIGNLGEKIRQRATEYSYQPAFLAPKAQILVVDDNAINRRVFLNLLKANKLAIDEAAGGMECIQMVQKKPYDVIFMDHMMPDLDGIETLHRIRALEDCPCHSTPVIALTANAISGAREMYLKEGFDSFLSKPIIPDKLEKMLMQILPEDKVTYEEIVTDSPEPIADSQDSPQSEEDSRESDFPQLDGIDWEYALLHLKDPDLLKDTVHSFYLGMDQDTDELLQFFQMCREKTGEQQRKALTQFEVKVHSMKSNAAMIGAMPLSGVAKILEYAARDGETEVLKAVTPFFLRDWQSMKKRLKTYVEDDAVETDSDKPQADWNVVRGDLQRLVDAMKDMDIDTADEVIDQIKEFQYPKPLIPLIEKLSLAVTNIDVRQAEKWSEELTNRIDKMEET